MKNFLYAVKAILLMGLAYVGFYLFKQYQNKRNLTFRVTSIKTQWQEKKETNQVKLNARKEKVLHLKEILQELNKKK